MVTMLDLDSTSVCDECEMLCTDLQYEDADEDQIVYGTKGLMQKSKKATYGDHMKTQSEEETEVKCTIAQRANEIVMLERKRR